MGLKGLIRRRPQFLYPDLLARGAIAVKKDDRRSHVQIVDVQTVAYNRFQNGIV